MAAATRKTPADLLRLLLLPLIDGYFLSMVLSGRLNHWSMAVLVGMLAFSGAGVVTTASLLPAAAGPWWRQGWLLARVYLLVLPPAWAVALLVGPLRALQLPYQSLLTALILAGTALNLWPARIPARLRRLYAPAQLMAALVTLMLLYGLETHRLGHLQLTVHPLLLLMVAVSVAAGFAATLLASLMQWRRPGPGDLTRRRILAAGGSLVLLAVAAGLLGVPVPAAGLWILEGATILAAAAYRPGWRGLRSASR
ncbi:conserved membrane protein of unknown function [Candidatus Hydrogenisulfobacillus filiaventi]|uniref:Uncharacterized protein n=1 Tax=Candidatus Hydrogenisulfobacillus filiaventi TaxID=2707344 RepID=A0A6F8ZE85_9FIRM|nr:conserved membrane protein of unknown function [Candidatus Hydrogenisulfobacillus filiaventi]